MDFETFLKKTAEQSGSDLFLTVGLSPTIKVRGKLIALDSTPLTEKDTREIILNLMSEAQKEIFLKNRELNFAIFRPNLGRFRVSAFQQKLFFGAVFRRIETRIPTLEELGMPQFLGELALENRGLIIMVGATGVGKSSTLAAMIGYRNENREGHIVSLEDPIEFMHEHKKSIITQREVGIDTDSFEEGLKNTLRQAPDVILIGEIRSQETMKYALAFSETGHLCLTTLHANNASQALDRIASFFPPDNREELWLDLSLNLKAIVAQRLIPMKNADKRIPALEIMRNTPAIADHIHKGEIDGIREFMMKTNELGMQTFDQALFKLYIDGKITEENALKFSDSENELRLMIKLNKGKGKTSGEGLSILE